MPNDNDKSLQNISPEIYSSGKKLQEYYKYRDCLHIFLTILFAVRKNRLHGNFYSFNNYIFESFIYHLTLQENSPIQRYMANTLNCSVSTINKIVNSNLNLKKAKKYNVYCIEHHVYELRTCCRTDK